MKSIIHVVPLEDKKIFVKFSDGISGTFDVKPYIKTDFFMQLNENSYFKNVSLFFGGVSWPDGQDLGPDTIAAELQK